MYVSEVMAMARVRRRDGNTLVREGETLDACLWFGGSLGVFGSRVWDFFHAQGQRAQGLREQKHLVRARDVSTVLWLQNTCAVNVFRALEGYHRATSLLHSGRAMGIDASYAIAKLHLPQQYFFPLWLDVISNLREGHFEIPRCFDSIRARICRGLDCLRQTLGPSTPDIGATQNGERNITRVSLRHYYL